MTTETHNRTSNAKISEALELLNAEFFSEFDLKLVA